MNTQQIADPTEGKCRCGSGGVEGVFGNRYCIEFPYCTPIRFVIRTSLTGGLILWGSLQTPMTVDYKTAVEWVEKFEKNPANKGVTFTIERAA